MFCARTLATQVGEVAASQKIKKTNKKQQQQQQQKKTKKKKNLTIRNYDQLYQRCLRHCENVSKTLSYLCQLC